MYVIETKGRSFRFDAGYGQVSVVDSEAHSPPVFFIHGNSACKEVFHKQFNSPLAESYRLIALDLPGCGASDNASRPQDVYRMKPMAEIVVDLLRALGATDAVLVGWSLGGHLALELAVEQDGLKGVVITGTPPSGPGRGEAEKAFGQVPAMALTPQVEFTSEDVDLYGNAIFGNAFVEDDAFRRAVVRADGQMRQTAIGDWVMNDHAGHHQVSSIENLKLPIAVIDGEEDPFINQAWMKKLTWGNLWRSEVHTVKGAGHAPFLENPDAYNKFLGEFLGSVFDS